MKDRETPEQFRARRAKEMKEQALRQRIGIASRLLATDRFQRVLDDPAENFPDGAIRVACRNALRVADLLIEEASK